MRSKSAVIQERIFIAMPWFTRIEFEKIKAMPGSGLTGSFEEWEQLAQRIFSMMGKSGPRPVRVEMTADGLREYARSIAADTLDASVRHRFAEMLEKQKDTSDSLPVNFVTCPNCAKRLEPIALLPEGPLTLACGCGEHLRLEDAGVRSLRERLKRIFGRTQVSEVSG
jgi:hypothetical protein